MRSPLAWLPWLRWLAWLPWLPWLAWLPGVLLALLCAPAPALAFHGQKDFEKSAMEGGGDGLYFTGSSRFRGYDCTICHQDAPEQMILTLDSEPASLLRTGQYEPDASYAMVVKMVGEHRGLDTMLNPNSFALETVDAEGEPAGLFVGLGSNVDRPPGQELVIAKGEQAAQTEWSFEWIAPAEGTGVVMLHLVGVDGDGADDRLGRSGDPYGDDVYVGTIALGEEGGLQPIRGAADDSSGCALTGGAAGPREPAPGALLILLGLALTRAARRLRRVPVTVRDRRARLDRPDESNNDAA